MGRGHGPDVGRRHDRDRRHGGGHEAYLGTVDTFDQAIGEFALAYADQTVRDHAALVAAVKARRIKALVEKASR